MLCVGIRGPSYSEARQQILQALSHADIVEFRLDLFSSIDSEALQQLRDEFSIPMTFTLRSSQQGGQYAQSEESRLSAIRRIASVKPDYLDIEYDVPRSFIEEVISQHPETKLILSYHNFTETPQDLDNLYDSLKTTPAFYYKIALMANSPLDTLRVLNWVQAKADKKLMVMSMGPHGQISRILAPIVGTPVVYASLDDTQQTAPGQLSAPMFVDRYHYKSLNKQSAIYGLIGNPVSQSVSDITHNHLLESFGINAVYVKIQVQESELPDFFQLAKTLPFKGLSVTMPLKECVMPCLDHIDPQAKAIGAVNTIVFDKGELIGFNTDAMGALNALEKEQPVKGKRIVIIGAGGAAKAIAYEACQRGGIVTIINRNEEKAKAMANKFKCHAIGLDRMSECTKNGYEILINSTPIAMPISADDVLPHTIVMDIKTRAQNSPLYQEASERGCQIVPGYLMFVEQAVGQFNLWLNIPSSECYATLKHKTLECV